MIPTLQLGQFGRCRASGNSNAEGPFTATFNPSDMDTSAFTLTVGDRKAVRTVNSQRAIGAYGMRSTGKWYWEAQVTDGGNVHMTGYGTSPIPAQTLTGASSGNGFYVNYYSGATSKNGGSVTPAGSGVNVGAGAIGSVYMLAIDYETGKVWVGRNGAWGGSGDPASGANPAYTFAVGDLAVGRPVFNGQGGFGDAGETIRLAAADMGYTIPTGFSAWSGT